MKAVITFHNIDNDGSVISFPREAFRDFIGSLARSSMACLDLDSILDPKITDGVALTFDDGMRSVYQNALPILKEYAVPAHLFLTSSVIGKSNGWPGNPPEAPRYEMMDWDQIEACHSAGIRIDAHTDTHPDMRRLDDAGLDRECDVTDSLIEQRLGRRPKYFAYPYGFSNAIVRTYMRDRYIASFTTELRTLSRDDDRAALPRLDSYYLQSPAMYRRLSAPQTQLYLRLRNLIRTLRGRF